MVCIQTHLTLHQRHSDPADDILIQQAQAGDHGAFELLVDRYSFVLLRLISHLVRDEHLAQDVLQHVFLQLYRSLPTLRQEGTLTAWLCQVARHRSFDELRRKRPVFFSEIAPDPNGSEISPLLLFPDPHRQPDIEQQQAGLLYVHQVPHLFPISCGDHVVVLHVQQMLDIKNVGRLINDQ